MSEPEVSPTLITPNMAPLTPPADAALYAALDLGTNSIKIVVADLANGRADRYFERTIITRIGEGMQAMGNRLREDAMRRTLDGLVELIAVAREMEVREIAAVGTAALRDAVNREEFLQRIEEQCGIRVDVIPGEEEARLSFLAARRDPQWREKTHLRVIDIGGGSTEIIEGRPHSSEIAARISVNYGAVKLTETFLRSDPPTIAQLDQANQAVRDAFNRIAEEAHRDQTGSVAFETGAAGDYALVGVGGTVTNLGAMDLGGKNVGVPLHGHFLTAERLEEHIDLLATSTVEQRQSIPGLDPRRADIILGGAILLAQALARLGAPGIAISTRGLRWGLLYDRFTSGN